MRSLAPALFLGTHYVEPQSPQSYRGFPSAKLESEGKLYHGLAFREQGMKDPTSGTSDFSFWATEQDLIRMMADAGYSKISVLGKDLQNNFPHITILARA